MYGSTYISQKHISQRPSFFYIKLKYTVRSNIYMKTPMQRRFPRSLRELHPPNIQATGWLPITIEGPRPVWARQFDVLLTRWQTWRADKMPSYPLCASTTSLARSLPAGNFSGPRAEAAYVACSVEWRCACCLPRVLAIASRIVMIVIAAMVCNACCARPLVVVCQAQGKRWSR